MIRTYMIFIDGFHKECPAETILEIIKIFKDNHNIKIDIPHTTDKFKKSYLDYSFATYRERFSIIINLISYQHFSYRAAAPEIFRRCLQC